MAIVAVVLILVIVITIILEAAKKGRAWKPFAMPSEELEAYLKCVFDCYKKAVPNWNGDWSKLPSNVQESCNEACSGEGPNKPNKRRLLALGAMLVLSVVLLAQAIAMGPK